MSEENREAGARDPWAPPEAPKVPLEKQGGGSGEARPPVHDQPTVAGMPGAEPFGYGTGPAQQPPGPAYAPPAGQPGPDPAYGYPGFAGPQGPPGFQQGPPGYQGYPGYPGYAHGGWGAPQPRNGFGITALVLGILSVLIFCSSVFAVAMGITAIVFGVLGRSRAKRGEATNPGQALAGIILGAVGVVLGIAMFALIIAGVIFDGVDSVDSQYDEDPPSLSTSLVVP